MIQAILDKYINTEVSNSLKIHTNSEMRECIIETFKLIVEDIDMLITNSDDDICRNKYPALFVRDLIEQYYNEQIK